MRRPLLILACATLLGGTQGCASQARKGTPHVLNYAKTVGKCIAKKAAECAAPPLRVWCPDCQHFIDSIEGKDPPGSM